METFRRKTAHAPYYASYTSIPPRRECVATAQPLIQPEPIPPLEHKQMEVRFAF